MKKNIALLLCSIAICCMGCDDETVKAGASSLIEMDRVNVKADTFAMSSRIDACGAIYWAPDSFLLGECETNYGIIRADVLTQVACPLGFEYPHQENAEVDSVCLFLYYRSWYGDGLSPLGISVYEMDRSTLVYDDAYPSDTSIASFCSMEDSVYISDHSQVVIPAEYEDSTYSSSISGYYPFVKLKLTDAFAKRFFSIRDFSSQESFNKAFKGLYLTTDFGGGAIMYITDISMVVYYHFTYRLESEQRDTTVSDLKGFYANSEVRQVNRYSYPDRDEVMASLSEDKEVNYIVAPANIYTTLSIPLSRIQSRTVEQFGDPDTYRLYVNRALLTVDVIYDDEAISSRPRDNWDTPSSYMLLIQTGAYDNFFAHNEVPNDTTAVLGTLVSYTDSMDVTTYSYSYDLSNMLTTQLRASEPVDTLSLYLVPVSVSMSTESSSTSIVAVKQMQTVSATIIKSAFNMTEPMNLKMVYSAFNKTR